MGSPIGIYCPLGGIVSVRGSCRSSWCSGLALRLQRTFLQLVKVLRMEESGEGWRHVKNFILKAVRHLQDNFSNVPGIKRVVRVLPGDVMKESCLETQLQA